MCFVQVVLRAWRECMLESRSENARSSVDPGDFLRWYAGHWRGHLGCQENTRARQLEASIIDSPLRCGPKASRGLIGFDSNLYHCSVILWLLLYFCDSSCYVGVLQGAMRGPAILPGAEVRARACRGEPGSPEMGSKRDPLRSRRFRSKKGFRV